MNPPPWAVDYLGIPYRFGGADLDGADCYGLVRLVYAERFGVKLPAYVPAGALPLAPRCLGPMFRAAVSGASWVHLPVDSPRSALALGDVALFNIGGHLAHCALYLGGGKILSAQEGMESCIEPLNSPLWAKRLAFFVRRRNPLR